MVNPSLTLVCVDVVACLIHGRRVAHQTILRDSYAHRNVSPTLCGHLEGCLLAYELVSMYLITFHLLLSIHYYELYIMNTAASCALDTLGEWGQR